MQDYDRLPIVAGFLDELACFLQVMLNHRGSPNPRLVGAATGKYRIAGPIIVRLPDGPSEICHLVHHVEQCLAYLLVVERRMKEVRPEPALHPKRINGECVQVRVLFHLGHEVERRVLPPVHFTCCEGFCGLPGVGDVPPDHLIEVHLLATG